MNTQQRNPPINLPRLEHRAKDDAWIAAFWQRVPFGMLATEWQGQTFQKPTLFVYAPEEHAIYFHGALEDACRKTCRLTRGASFCAAEMGRLLPVDTAMEFGVEYASAVVFGPVSVLHDPGEAERARAAARPLLPAPESQARITGLSSPRSGTSRPSTGWMWKAWSGKEEVSSADFPGAFSFPYPEKG